MKKVKLSIVLATFNEEKNIGLCLEAVKDLADEIIIVDGQSTDRTVEIAKEYGAKVTVTTNKPIFHINKQMAIDKAKGDWILQLDADEIVTKPLRGEILAVITTPRRSAFAHRPRSVAYYIPRKNFFLGRWLKKGGQYPDYVIRLLKRGQAFLPCKSVHEQMVVVGKTGYLKNHLLHYTAPNFGRYLENANRYTSLTASEFQNQNLPINPLTTIIHIIIVPLKKFFSLYIRHKGFQDGFPGFVFALFSGLHYPIAFFKYWEKRDLKCKK